MLRLPVLLIFISLTLAPLAWGEESAATPPTPEAAAPPVAVSPVVVSPLVSPVASPVALSPLPLDEAARLAEPEIPKSEPPELAAEEFSLGWTLVRTMVVLAMVVALAYLTLNIGLRKLLGIRAPLGTSVVTVLERVSLDQKRSLFVVEAGGEVLLIGGGDSALSLIAKLDRAEVDKLRSAAPASPVQLSPFLKKLLGRPEVSKAETTPPPPAPNLDGNP